MHTHQGPTVDLFDARSLVWGIDKHLSDAVLPSSRNLLARV